MVIAVILVTYFIDHVLDKKWLTEYFIRKGIVPKAEREVYEYGFAITICSIASTLGLLLLGLLLGQFLQRGPDRLVILHLSVLRRGYHASTHLRCFPTMCAGLLAGLGFSLLPCPLLTLAVLAVPLTLHPNKLYLLENKKALILRSRLSVLANFAVAAALAALQWVPVSIVTAGYLLSALSRLYAKAHYKPTSA